MLISFTLLALAQSDPSCPAYTCRSPSQHFSPGTCLFANLAKNPPTYYAEQCKGGLCEQSLRQSNLTCSYKPSDPIAIYPGAKCGSPQFTCAYGHKFCNTSTSLCEGATEDEACTGSQDCSPGLRCASGVCKPLLAEDDPTKCASEYDCEPHLTCSRSTKRCTRYFSVSAGTELSVFDCNRQSHTSTLCENLYCGEGLAGKFYCLGLLQHSGASPVSCTLSRASFDCTSVPEVFTQKSYSSGCFCGYGTEQKAYCAGFYGDPQGHRYLSMLKSWVHSEAVTHCNTVGRLESKCVIDWWSPKNASDFLYNAQEFELFPLLQDVRSCVAHTLFPSAYLGAHPWFTPRIDLISSYNSL